MTDPQTVADAAEPIRRLLGRAAPDADLCLSVHAARLRAFVAAHDALLADRKRMAAELEQVRGDLARARDDSSEVWLAERGEEMRDALTVAAELIDRLARSTPCDIDHNGHCGPHRVREAPLPCPHPLGRRFVEAWRTVQADPASPDVTTAPQSAPQEP